MVLTPIEIIAAVFAVVGLIKLLVVVIDVKAWMPVSRAVYGNPRVSSPIILILAVIVFYYLIQSFTIVDIFAVMAFTSLIFALAILPWGKDLMKLADKMIKSGFSNWMWLLIFVWGVAMVWVLYSVFR